MYTIYADGKPLYAPHLFHEGCGVISPKLTVELNKAGSLEFTIPHNNTLYDQVQKLKTIITANYNSEEIFRGRILYDEKDFYKQKKTYCEGALAFLLDSKQRPYSEKATVANHFRRYISNHNSRVEDNKKFTVGNITVLYKDENGKEKEDEQITIANTEYSTTLDEINDKLVSNFGGYLKIRKVGNVQYIDWLKESGGVSGQTIEFGVNLLDLTEYISAENIFTVLIPIGGTPEDKKEKVTIKSVNDNKDYIEDETAVSLFGRIEHSEEWSDILSATKLLNTAKKVLAKNIEMAVTLNVRAADLYLFGVNTEMIKLGDWVRVVSNPHGLDKNFQCTKIVYDMVSPDQTEYTFGVSFTSLTDQKVANDKKVNTASTAVQSAVGSANASADRANQAAQDVENIIINLDGNYVTVANFNAFKEEIEEEIDNIQVSGGGVSPSEFNAFKAEVEAELDKIPTDVVTGSEFDAFKSDVESELDQIPTDTVSNSEFSSFKMEVEAALETIPTDVVSSASFTSFKSEVENDFAALPDTYVDKTTYADDVGEIWDELGLINTALADTPDVTYVHETFVEKSTYNAHVSETDTKLDAMQVEIDYNYTDHEGRIVALEQNGGGPSSGYVSNNELDQRLMDYVDYVQYDNERADMIGRIDTLEADINTGLDNIIDIQNMYISGVDDVIALQESYINGENE